MRDFWLVFLTANIAGMVLALQHYALLPLWARTARHPMPLLVRYIIGATTVICAVSILFVHWQAISALDAIAALAFVVIGGGLWTSACYGIDELTAYLDSHRSVHGETN